LARELLPAGQGRPRGRVSFSGVELWQLPKAGEFSSDPALQNPVELIKEFRRQPVSQLLRTLIEGSDDELRAFSGRRPGRPRMPGDWPALFLAYVASGSVAVERFRNAIANKDTGLLEACGFEDVPSRQAVDLRFAELECHSDAFVEVTRALIGFAKEVDPRIGESVFVDGTAFHSASALQHACSDSAACREAGGVRTAQLRRATTSEVSDEHLRETEAAEPELTGDNAVARRTRGPIITLPSVRGPIEYRCFVIRGHQYLSRDLSSGVRWYDKTRSFWLGGYLQAAVDMCTGLPLAISVFPADLAEWDGYPRLFGGMVAALGGVPRIVSVDRGFALRPFHEFNTRRGVAVVAPFRKRKQGETTVDRRRQAFDEDGVPRCRFCGGPGDQDSRELGLAFDASGEPRIRFRCLLELTHDCRAAQSIRCAADWVQLA